MDFDRLNFNFKLQKKMNLKFQVFEKITVLLTPNWHVFRGLEASGGGCGYSQGLRGPSQVISRPLEKFDFSPCIEKCKHFFFRLFFDILVAFNSCGLFSFKTRDLGPNNEVLKERQTKAWDHLQTIELEKLSTKLVSKVS